MCTRNSFKYSCSPSFNSQSRLYAEIRSQGCMWPSTRDDDLGTRERLTDRKARAVDLIVRLASRREVRPPNRAPYHSRQVEAACTRALPSSSLSIPKSTSMILCTVSGKVRIRYKYGSHLQHRSLQSKRHPPQPTSASCHRPSNTHFRQTMSLLIMTRNPSRRCAQTPSA